MLNCYRSRTSISVTYRYCSGTFLLYSTCKPQRPHIRRRAGSILHGNLGRGFASSCNPVAQDFTHISYRVRFAELLRQPSHARTMIVPTTMYIEGETAPVQRQLVYTRLQRVGQSFFRSLRSPLPQQPGKNRVLTNETRRLVRHR